MASSPVFTVRLVFFGPAGPGFYPLFTVPENMRFVLRDLRLTNLGAEAGVTFYAVAGSFQVVLEHLPAVPANATWSWLGRQAFNQGDQLGFNTQLSSAHVLATGYQFSVPAP